MLSIFILVRKNMAANNVEGTAYVCWFDYEAQTIVRVPLTTTGQLWYIFGRDVTQERVAWWKSFWNAIKCPTQWARPPKNWMRWRAFSLAMTGHDWA